MLEVTFTLLLNTNDGMIRKKKRFGPFCYTRCQIQQNLAIIAHKVVKSFSDDSLAMRKYLAFFLLYLEVF